MGAASSYYDGLKSTHDGSPQDLSVPGAAGAYRLGDGSIVVRKDINVLIVDVSGISDPFAAYPTSMSRADVAWNVTTTLMACWTGG